MKNNEIGFQKKKKESKNDLMADEKTTNILIRFFF